MTIGPEDLADLGNPYNPEVWEVGYQRRQFGTGGPSIVNALANPPTTMVAAVEKGMKRPVPDTTGTLIPGTDGPEELPYGN